jgi:DNA-binding XRE family transcriptional regulator
MQGPIKASMLSSRKRGICSSEKIKGVHLNPIERKPCLQGWIFLLFHIKISRLKMNNKEFSSFRKALNKTQKQVAELLGTSIKAVHSYEQGWRKVPAHVERQLIFLISRMRGGFNEQKPCWRINKCPPERKKRCPTWEFNAGKLCWLINGTMCKGVIQKDWREKMDICRSCGVLKSLRVPQSGEL